jgi:threonine synthase
VPDVAAPALGFEDVLLTGLARDGGLYVPEAWPHLKKKAIAAMAGQPYAAIATEVMQPFVGKAMSKTAFAKIVTETYAGFRHQAVAPLVEIGEGIWLQELFHGPTLAFKDVALQLVGRLYDHVLKKRGQRVTIIGATSGDTGSAALEACRDRDAVDVRRDALSLREERVDLGRSRPRRRAGRASIADRSARPAGSPRCRI